MKIDGISDFDDDIYLHNTNTSDNTICLTKRISPSEYIVDLDGFFWSYYESKESAVAFLYSKQRGGWGIFRPNYVTYVTKYTVDLNLQLLEKKDVYVAGSKL